MTFDRQVWWSRALGAAGLVVAAVTGWAVTLIDTPPAFLLSGVSQLASISAVLLIFGGGFRPAHRWMWWHVVAPSALYSPRQKRRAAWGPMRWWLHLDRDLNDRDGQREPA